ncbi:MAG: dicarboxylate/amino acid:cation symporter [Treponema sp.]|nr:dicarboxylate/amino acid:cation symporter [Treponema sp.]MBR3542732.1 dicarboxylate/amino acid:cation symporter [Treponema sp.]
MKLWLKYLIGAALGFAAALILPLDSLREAAALSFITDLIIRIGRYALLPLLFFSGIMAVYRMREDSLLLRASLWTGGTILASSVLLTALGFFSILLIRLPRIPITTERVTEIASVDLKGFFQEVFPYSAFEALQKGSFLLPAFVFALIIGFGCCMNHTNIKPVISLTDGLSELFYNVSTVFTELFSAGIVFVMCSWTLQFKSVIKSGVFTPLIIMLCAQFIVLAGIVYPLVTRFVCRNGKPLKILRASIAPFFVALFSGDTNLALPVEIRLGKETLGIRQRVNGFAFPLFSIFARGGTALVSIICFVVIWRSYSTLNIEFFDMLAISLTAFALSFVMGNLPVGGTFMTLTVLCSMFGRGMETGYLLLRPAAAIIGSFAALIDAATAMFGCYIVANNTRTIERHRS